MPSLRWHILLLRSNSEWQTHCEALSQGYACYYPMRMGHRRLGRWAQGIARPLFPAYAFIGLEPGQSLEKIRRLNGVRDFLRAGGSLVVMPQAQLERCRETCDRRYRDSWPSQRRLVELKVRDWVAVPSGAFEGTPVEVEAIDKSGRIRASLGSLELSFESAAVHTSVTSSAGA